MHHFAFIKKGFLDHDCKIYEALLIKKHQPKLNKQLYANGSFFLLNYSTCTVIQLFNAFFLFFPL